MWMVFGIVCAESIPRPTNLLTNNTRVDETKVEIRVLLTTLLRLKHFSTLKAGKLVIFGLTYHGLHNSIQI